MQQNKMNFPDYEVLAAALQRTNSQLSAAECHGLLTGALNTEDTTLISRFFTDDTGQIQQDDLLAELISQIVHLTVESFKSEDFNFKLMLPADERPLDERSRALADWCGGYVMGLLEAGIKEFESLPDEAAEVAKDMLEISQLDASAEDSGSEYDLMQLEEYVRVGVQLIYAVLTKIKDEESNQSGLSGDE